ncbi:hypothetical protein [Micromonospora aurantiaca (nom. illeg.)]|uniref:hypothetical protein n=1 Tax=Micromonospora aurantiaca (nom. illeg.) TaxID=47850 RepID=UPI003F49B8A5
MTGAATAGVLLRDAPAGNYVAETKVTLDLGEDSMRNYRVRLPALPPLIRTVPTAVAALAPYRKDLRADSIASSL